MSQGVIPVAILGSETFDVLDVDVSTLAFGPDGAPLAHRNGPQVKDANRDGVDDLLAHFRTEETAIDFGDTEACVTGELLDGTHRSATWARAQQAAAGFEKRAHVPIRGRRETHDVYVLPMLEAS